MVCLRGLPVGEGSPKICVPITGQTPDQIFSQAECVSAGTADMAEWRADCCADIFSAVRDTDALLEVLKSLRNRLGELPLLFTLRTAREGGSPKNSDFRLSGDSVAPGRELLENSSAFSDGIRFLGDSVTENGTVSESKTAASGGMQGAGVNLSPEEYRTFLVAAAKSELVDAVDVEMFRGYDKLKHGRTDWRSSDLCNGPTLGLVREIKKHAAVVGSFHNFAGTPSREEMLKRIFFMEKMGADIIKIAVMPKEPEDVLRLMETALLAKRLLMDKPLIAMSMGKLGAVTRIAGETFGSAVTFACVGQKSAPGQMEASALKQAMALLTTAD